MSLDLVGSVVPIILNITEFSNTQIRFVCKWNERPLELYVTGAKERWPLARRLGAGLGLLVAAYVVIALEMCRVLLGHLLNYLFLRNAQLLHESVLHKFGYSTQGALPAQLSLRALTVSWLLPASTAPSAIVRRFVLPWLCLRERHIVEEQSAALPNAESTRVRQPFDARSKLLWQAHELTPVSLNSKVYLKVIMPDAAIDTLVGRLYVEESSRSPSISVVRSRLRPCSLWIDSQSVIIVKFKALCPTKSRIHLFLQFADDPVKMLGGQVDCL